MMKTYEEMIQWMVDNGSLLRYNEWPAVLAISEIYDVPQETVYEDVKFEKNLREQALKEQRKAEHRASNEQRRLANLVNKGVE
jgi:hypothetical protein